MPRLMIHAIDCKVHSTGVDEAAAQAVSQAFQSAAAVGAASAPFLGPIGEAVTAALQGASLIVSTIVDLSAALDRAGDYPDQLYLSLSNDPGTSQRIWPESYPTYNIRGGQIVRLNLIIPFSDVIDVNFWEYDSGSSDDFLGRLTVDASHVGGVRYQAVVRPSEGNIYVIAYSVEIPPPQPSPGSLLWYKHPTWQTAAPGGWAGPIEVGTDWGGFKSVFATSDGVVYAIQNDGKLLWYKHPTWRTAAPGGWESPVEVSTGWANFKSVFATSDGVIYAIQTDGKLLWYKHPGWQTGARGLAGPVEVGTGWAGFTSVIATSNGVVYGINPVTG